MCRSRGTQPCETNRLANAGILVLLFAISAATLLVVELMFDCTVAWIFSGGVAVGFAILWYVLPLSRRASDGR